MNPPITEPHGASAGIAKRPFRFSWRVLICITGIMLGIFMALTGVGSMFAYHVKHLDPADAASNPVPLAVGCIAGGLFIMGASLWGLMSRPSQP